MCMHQAKILVRHNCVRATLLPVIDVRQPAKFTMESLKDILKAVLHINCMKRRGSFIIANKKNGSHFFLYFPIYFTQIPLDMHILDQCKIPSQCAYARLSGTCI